MAEISAKVKMGVMYDMHTEAVVLFYTPSVNTGEDKVLWIENQPSFISKGSY